MAQSIEQFDAFGEAFQAFLDGEDPTLTVHLDLTETEFLSASYFFRTYEEMPLLEQKALQLARGKILDAGAGAGCHSLWLHNERHQTYPIDLSPGAIAVMKQRGLERARNVSFFDLKQEKYDTILMLMNGVGLAGQLPGLPNVFRQARNLLHPEGQILLDSSDLRYMYEEEDGTFRWDLDREYYGEVVYQIEYEGRKGEPFPWLFVDHHTLTEVAENEGYNVEIIAEGPHYDYLAQLTLKK